MDQGLVEHPGKGPPLHLGVEAIKKGAFGPYPTTATNLYIYVYIYICRNEKE